MQLRHYSSDDASASLSSWLHHLLIVLFHLLVITVPFVFSWVNEELFEFNKMLLTYAITAGILGLWAARQVIEKRFIVKQTPFDLSIGIFVLSQLAATIFSIHPATSWYGYYTRFHGGLLSTLTYVGLYYAFVSNVERKHLPAFLFSTLTAALGITLYSIPEHFGYSPSCLLITKQFNASCWVQDVQSRIFGTFGQPNWLAAYAIMLIPVALSLWLGNLLRPQASTPEAKNRFEKTRATKHDAPDSSFFTLFDWTNRTLVQQIVFATVSLTLFVTLLFTQSRSGFLGLVLGGDVFALVSGWILSRSGVQPGSMKRLLAPLLLMGTAFLALALWFGTPFTPTAITLLAKISPVSPAAPAPTTATAPAATATASAATDSVASSSPTPPPVANRLDIGGTDSGEIRKIVWQGAIDVWKRYPLLGSGVETFAYSYYLDRPVAHNNVSEWDFLYNKAHNEFLNFLATTGLIGLLSYGAMLGWFGFVVSKNILVNRKGGSSNLDAISSATSAQPLPLADQLLLAGLVSGVIALSVSNFFGFSTVMVTVLMYLYFAIAAVVVDSNATQSSPTTSAAQLSSTHLTIWQWLCLGTIIMLVSWSSATVGSIWLADRDYATGKQLSRANQLTTGALMLTQAIELRPTEALYHDELSTTYAKLAVALAVQKDSTQSAAFAQAALAASDQALRLNPVHLNFYKTRARVLITLSQLDDIFLKEAATTLEAAITRSPTDAKLWYNLALVQQELGQPQEAEKTLLKTLELRPRYDQARVTLAELYESQQNFAAALEQYNYILAFITPGNTIITTKINALEATTSAKPKTTAP